MIPLQATPGPEKPEKPPAPGGATPFSPFSPFSEPGKSQNEGRGTATADLAAVRAYRRTQPPKLSRKRRQAAKAPAALPPLSAPPGVPVDWCEGVALLATLAAPDTITLPRWRMFQTTAGRLLHDHGAELHAAGWDALDLFGLHRTHPATNPPGWGLAWLLGKHGEVLDVAPGVIGMRQGPDGARLAFRRCGAARAATAVAWSLC